MITTKQFYATIILFLTILSVNAQSFEKPEVFKFGATLDSMKIAMKELCASVNEREISPIQLPTAMHSQKQLDCEGFMFEGKQRKAELIFADGILDLVWIHTEKEEEGMLLSRFKSVYGEPTHIKDDITFFLQNGTALRNNPHEVLFISDRLKESFKQFLENKE